MAGAFLAGFALGLSLILAIGAQNAFVLRQGLRGAHVLAVVLACAVSDGVLIAAGVAGFGAAAERLPALAALMRHAGAGFLLVYGALSFRAAIRPGALAPAADAPGGAGAAVASVLAITWLNPHVHLDTVVLIGSVAAGHAGARTGFAAGAVAASFVFFFALGYGARLLAPVFARPAAWRVLEAGIGAVMWAIALSLVLG